MRVFCAKGMFFCLALFMDEPEVTPMECLLLPSSRNLCGGELQFTDGKGIKINMHASCYRGGCTWPKKMLNRPIHLSSQDAKERLNTLYIFIYLTCRILTQYFLLLRLGRFVDSLMYREGCPPDYDFDPSKCLFLQLFLLAANSINFNKSGVSRVCGFTTN